MKNKRKNILTFVVKNWVFIALASIFVLFNAFALLRTLPVNTELAENLNPTRGDYSAKVFKVFRYAEENANEAFMEDFDNFTYWGRNPTFFRFVAELFIRVGASRPFPIQLFSIFLFNIGLLINYAWVKKFFKSKAIGLIATAFVAFTPYLLFHSTSIHQEPYEFLFFGATMLFYQLFLSNKNRKWLYFGLTVFSFFVLTQSYYMFYMSTVIMLLAVHCIKNKKVFSKHLLVLLAVPVFSFALVLLQAGLETGGLQDGIFGITEIFVARTVDARVDGSEWYPDETFVRFEDYANAPNIISSRISAMFHLSLLSWLVLLLATFYIKVQKNTGKIPREYWIVPVALIAGLSWNVVFFQHTVIHAFAGQYGYFAWMLIFAVSAKAIYEFVSTLLKKRGATERIFILSLLALVLLWPILLNLLDIYVANIVVYAKNLYSAVF